MPEVPSQGGKGGVHVGPVTGAGVDLAIADLAPSGHGEEAAELEGVALDTGLRVPRPHGAHTGEQASRSQRAQQAALQAERLVALSRRVGVDLETGNLVFLEVLRKRDCTVADEDKVCATGPDVPAPAAQLRACLFAVRSTVVADVGEDERAVCDDVAEVDLAALGVENGNVGKLAGHLQ